MYHTQQIIKSAQKMCRTEQDKELFNSIVANCKYIDSSLTEYGHKVLENIKQLNKNLME